MTLIVALVASALAADFELPVVCADEGRLATTADARTAAHRPDVIELAAQSIQGVLAVPVVLGSRREAWFLVDTGAQLGMIARSVLSDWGLPADVGMPFDAAGAGGRALDQLRIVGLDRVAYGDRALSNHAVTVGDLRGLSGAGGRPIGGILGHPELTGYVVEFDVAAPAVRWYTADAFAARAEEGVWDALPAKFEREIVPGAGPSQVLVSGTVDGAKGQLLLDTGCSRSAISADMATRAGWKPTGEVTVMALDGPMQAWEGTGRLQLGEVALDGVSLLVVPELASQDGRLCMDVFQQRRLVVDYPGQRVLMARG